MYSTYTERRSAEENCNAHCIVSNLYLHEKNVAIMRCMKSTNALEFTSGLRALKIIKEQIQ